MNAVIIFHSGKPTAIVHDTANANTRTVLRLWLEYQGVPVANRRPYTAEPCLNATTFEVVVNAVNMGQKRV